MSKVKITSQQYIKLVSEGLVKPTPSKKLKITQEQYSRLKSLGLIKEGLDVTGGLDRVDKLVNKEKSLRESETDIKSEVLDLIKYLYKKTQNLSPFWETKGITYDEILDTLLSKKMIINVEDRYELSKTLGTPQEAIASVEKELGNLVNQSEPKIELNTEISEEDNQERPTINKEVPESKKPLNIIAFNREIAIFRDKDSNLYAFYYYDKDKNDFIDYASVVRNYIGKDEEGNPEFEYDTDFEVDSDVISDYVNDNQDKMSRGEGIDAWESGVDLVRIDDTLKKDLLDVYDKDKNIVSALSSIDENREEIKTSLKKPFDEKPIQSGETPEEKRSRIAARLRELKAKEEERRSRENEVSETTSAGSAGAFTGPMSSDVVRKEIPEIVDETTSTASAGSFQYDTPGGLTLDLKSHGKTKAQKTPQYDGGAFVELPACSKLDNNKAAQNGGCNVGL